MDKARAGYDAVVLAGGAARRLGGTSKPQLTIGGSTLLDRALAAVSGAQRVVVAGPELPRQDGWGTRVRWCREQPAGGGPVAAIAAAIPHTAADVVVVLAVDQPWIAPAVPHLLAAVPVDGLARLVSPDGQVHHLAAAWHRPALVGALAGLGEPSGAAMRTLVAGVVTVDVADPDGWSRDCDTWPDVQQARARAGQVHG